MIELGGARSSQFDACIEDERQYRAPHLPAGLLITAMSRVGYHGFSTGRGVDPAGSATVGG
ncbi:hypothetical protein F511_20488 [Dorcoceras hygrometricum]|uniref:Uncharacterized protein n=1 Tax=Dorcoceras hygrometricum TaxID=472368 RepID=A0A2Z7BJW2_9LAMI|nr:hypothetical protein F511_20488 [Dorcoceras hygrometricum]